MKFLIGLFIIGVSALIFFFGWQQGIISERSNGRLSTLKFDGQIALVNVNEIKTFRLMSSGRMRTYILFRGDVEVKNDTAKIIEIYVNDQQDFLDMVKTYFGIEDELVIKSILPNTGRWVAGCNLNGDRVIFSPENRIAFAEMRSVNH